MDILEKTISKISHCQAAFFFCFIFWGEKKKSQEKKSAKFFSFTFSKNFN